MSFSLAMRSITAHDLHLSFFSLAMRSITARLILPPFFASSSLFISVSSKP
jgi:hypothetical protein